MNFTLDYTRKKKSFFLSFHMKQLDSPKTEADFNSSEVISNERGVAIVEGIVYNGHITSGLWMFVSRRGMVEYYPMIGE